MNPMRQPGPRVRLVAELFNVGEDMVVEEDTVCTASGIFLPDQLLGMSDGALGRMVRAMATRHDRGDQP